MIIETKILEIRDQGTFMPMIAINMGNVRNTKEVQYLVRSAGYGYNTCILLIDPQGRRGASYDPWQWTGSRTLKIAHQQIIEDWDDLCDGDVIDVEYILKETTKKKRSQKYDTIDEKGTYHMAVEE